MKLPTYDELILYLTETHALDDETIRRRAQFLLEDLARIQMKDFALLPLQSIPAPHVGYNFTLVEYTFGTVPFNAQNAGDPFNVRQTVREMSGTGVDRGDLLYLSKICELGRRLIPDMWFNSQALMSDIRDAQKHLSTLNEIWWLSVWDGFLENELGREYRMSLDLAKRVDWRFPLTVGGNKWWISLEVKQPIHSFADRAYQKPHHFFASHNKDGSLREDDPSLKFRESESNEINVLAVTWFDEISANLESEIQEFLDGTFKIDAVLVWAPGDKRRGAWYRMFPRFRDMAVKSSVLHTVLKDPDDEDHSRVIWTIFPRTINSILEESREI